MRFLLVLASILALRLAFPLKDCISVYKSESSGTFHCGLCEYSLLHPKSGECDIKLSQKVPNCRFYSDLESEVYCIECELGYYLDTDQNICIKCPLSNCAICRGKDRCFGCAPGYELSVDGKSCVKGGKCKTENCEVCYRDQFSDVCKVCKTGFSLNSLTHRQCLQSVPNCSILNEYDPKKCSECAAGYVATTAFTCVKFSFARSALWAWSIVPISVIFLALLVYWKHRKLGKNELATEPFIDKKASKQE